MTLLNRIIPPDRLKRNNIFLLVCLLILILFFPIIAKKKELLGDIIFNGIIIASIFSLNFAEKTRKVLFVSGGTTVCLLWLSFFFENRIWDLLAFLNLFLFEIFILFFMTLHIAHSKNVDKTIILNSINGYLIIGLLGALLLEMAELAQRFFFRIDSPIINVAGDTLPQFHDYLYFSFVTVTTLGYGDITPATASAKSIAFLIAITGQLYLTILVAILVGKYLVRPKA